MNLEVFQRIIFLTFLVFSVLTFTFLFFLILDNPFVYSIFYALVIFFLAFLLSVLDYRLGLLGLMLLLPWHNFFLLLLSYKLDVLSFTILASSKELYLLGMLLGLIKYLNYIKFDFIYFSIFLLIAYSFFGYMKVNTGFAGLVSLREIVLIPSFFLTGYLLSIKGVSINFFLTSLLITSSTVLLFSFTENLLFTGNIWSWLGAENYFKLKFSNAIFDVRTYLNLPFHWFTFAEGDLYRRMVGPVTDATSLSRYLAFPALVFLVFTKKTNINFLFFLIFLSAIFLTYGRGGLIIVLMGFSILLITKKPLIGIMVSLIAAIYFLTSTSLLNINNPNAIRHLTGLAEGILAASNNFYGNGLGTSGSISVLYAGTLDERVEESFIGGLGYQLGIPGIVLYSLFMVSIIYQIAVFYFNEVSTTSKSYLLLAIIMLIGVYATSFLANSAIAPISAGLVFLYCGILYPKYKYINL